MVFQTKDNEAAIGKERKYNPDIIGSSYLPINNHSNVSADTNLALN
jgi:hypothetical protein